MDTRGKKVAITGGNSGIGRAAALQLARDGCSVAVLARNQERLDAVVAEMTAIGASGATFLAVSVDLRSEASVAAAAARVLDELGGLDLLVCNAGYARALPVSSHEIDQFTDLMETNFFGHVRITKAFLPHFKRQRSGAICLVTSMLGFMSFYGYAAYSASKFAIVGFAEALRQEMFPYGVEVGVFYPPTTDTPGLVTENESKPALSWKIEGTSRKFTAEQVAAALVVGVRRGRFTHMIGLDSWAIWYLSRWTPGLVRWVLDREVRGWVRENGIDV